MQYVQICMLDEKNRAASRDMKQSSCVATRCDVRLEGFRLQEDCFGHKEIYSAIRCMIIYKVCSSGHRRFQSKGLLKHFRSQDNK